MPTLFGNTTGLGPSATKILERIYRRKVPATHIATPELIRSLAEASQQTGRQVGVLVHRSGEVETVIVGDATRLMLPDIGRLRAAEGRFRALRLVHTHLHNEPLTRDDVVDLVRLRLDLVAAIQLSPGGEARTMHYAYNTPVHDRDDGGDRLPYRMVGPLPVGQVDVDFGELIAALEDEFAKRSAPAWSPARTAAPSWCTSPTSTASPAPAPCSPPRTACASSASWRRRPASRSPTASCRCASASIRAW
ncbi:MAG: hypothetical protein WKG00_29210 [Polyangiaceae bacterium]